MNQQFDLKRLGYLGRSYIIHNWRSQAVAAGAVAGVLFLVNFIGAWIGGVTTQDYSIYLIISMAIYSVVNASMSFTALHDKNHNEAYLLLPASSLEKVLVKLISTSVVLPFAIIVLITVTSIISEGLTGLIFQTGFAPLNPFLGIHFEAWLYVVIGQSIFFLGAAWFKKAHFIKTVLALAIMSIAFGILGGILFRIVFASYFNGFWIMKNIDIDMENMMIQNYPGLANFLMYTARIIFYAILAPFCWFTAWLRVKETQTSDGV